MFQFLFWCEVAIIVATFVVSMVVYFNEVFWESPTITENIEGIIVKSIVNILKVHEFLFVYVPFRMPKKVYSKVKQELSK